MSERDAFLRAIAECPADDTARLVFADWLDEHGEHDRAAFLRLQIKRARSGRKLKFDKLPPREQELFDANREQWLGPLAGLDDHDGFDATFRRGFVDSAMIHGRIVGEYASAIREYCPALTELDVVGVRGYGQQLANAPFLHSVRILQLEDWPFPADAEALATSPHLSRLESLSLWIGSANDETVCRAIGSSKALPALRQVELVQLFGGMQAGERAVELAAHAGRMCGLVNSTRGKPVAAVYRPFAELFPLAEHVGYDLDSGTVPDGRRVLVNCGPECEVLYFDSEGRLLSGERLDLSASLRRKPDYHFMKYNRAEVHELLRERIGFTSAMIWVREFTASTVLPNSYLDVYKFGGMEVDLLAAPDDSEAYHTDTWEEAIESVRYWLRSSNFCIGYGNECWADESGSIHTT